MPTPSELRTAALDAAIAALCREDYTPPAAEITAYAEIFEDYLGRGRSSAPILSIASALEAQNKTLEAQKEMIRNPTRFGTVGTTEENG